MERRAMKRSLRFWLPFGQFILALALLVSNLSGPPGHRWERLDARLSYGLNAPSSAVIFAVRNIVSPYIEWLKDTVFYLALVVGQWYLVALELEKRGTRGSNITPATRVRGVADLVLVAAGAWLCCFGLMAPRVYHDVLPPRMRYGVLP